MRTIIQVKELQVGDKVAIVGSSYNPQTGYAVTKVNKLRAVLTRTSDGYQRFFSVKRDCEVPASGVKGYVARYSSIITEAEADRMARITKQGQDFRLACQNLSTAAANRNFAEIQRCMKILEYVNATGAELQVTIAAEREAA